MRPKTMRILSGLVALLVVMSACSLFQQTGPSGPTNKSAASTAAPTATPLPTVGATVAPGSQPVQVSGTFTYTNDIITTYYVEPAAALNDMHGFVMRDKEWKMPIQSQVLGYASIDATKKTGTFWIQLPEQPAATFNDVSNSSKKETGLQIFAAVYSPNLTGGPYAEGDDPNKGWPNYLASVVTDPENKDEVTGGKLIIWSPDNNQHFPTGFGPDGLLFTKDDPEGPVPAGWSVIDLDQKPFKIIRDPEPQMTFYEPKDVAIKDFSNQSYTQAFDNMFNIVSKEYAFNGVQGKPPDWTKLYAELKPRVQQAEANHDGYAYYLALHDFVMAFKDGHVNLNGGSFDQQYFQSVAGGGYGFAVRELDDGTVLVTHIVQGTPADQAGMKVGDTLVQFNGKPAAQAIADTPLVESPESTQMGRLLQQSRYLTRNKVGGQATVTFQSGNSPAKTVTLSAVPETEDLAVTSPFAGYDPNALPVNYRVLPTGQGYIRINSLYDDLNLVMRIFQRALQKFKDQQIDTVIIDMRQNPGGSPLGLAGFLSDQTIQMGQLEYYSTETGKFEPNGPRDTIPPDVEQYRFAHLALLVAQSCYSACELESYGFSQLPGIKVVGETSTAGVEAEVARGQFKLPEGMSMQIPTGRFTLPDGSIFLEGKGVQPNVKVPVNAQTVLSNDDPVLTAAEQATK